MVVQSAFSDAASLSWCYSSAMQSPKQVMKWAKVYAVAHFASFAEYKSILLWKYNLYKNFTSF